MKLYKEIWWLSRRFYAENWKRHLWLWAAFLLLLMAHSFTELPGRHWWQHVADRPLVVINLIDYYALIPVATIGIIASFTLSNFQFYYRRIGANLSYTLPASGSAKFLLLGSTRRSCRY